MGLLPPAASEADQKWFRGRRVKVSGKSAADLGTIDPTVDPCDPTSLEED